ncbi:hypothetical protein [Flexithrix dorotheae]|uniref:hypothetical protein n=1 Tax=Flexithrix dorotheae TaxID=70993 RepID=UPI00037F973E|nr:hypothetical protein [Flexithrix dorotheae]
MKNIILTSIYLLIFSTQNFAQSGWVKEKGTYFIQGSFNVFSSDQYYNTSGELQTSALGTDFTTTAFKVYGEYGITNRLTLTANLPLIKSNGFSTTETIFGVGDLRIGAKYQLLKSFPLSLAIEPEIPTGNGEQFAFAKTENDLGFREKINIPTSDGEFNVWSTLAASLSSNNGRYYGSIYGGFNWRTKGLSHQLKVGTEAGTLFFDKLWIIGKLWIQESLTENPKKVPFVYGEGTEFTAFGITALYKINKKISITAEYLDYSGLITGRKNIYDGPAFGLGVAFEY